jgi:hypothetical protein
VYVRRWRAEGSGLFVVAGERGWGVGVFRFTFEEAQVRSRRLEGDLKKSI